jgi:16S rRNA (adenine1518-N6/adenine1519-N6)-dimethyltransferase
MKRAAARKRFGQHFLTDRAVVERIVDTVSPGPEDLLVEIGPGRGVLTRPLLDRCGRVHAVEIDRDLAAALSVTFAKHDNFVLHVGDALRFDFRQLSETLGGPLRVVGNLPYNISTPLLLRLLSQIDVIRDLVVMVQKEVALRLAAEPGGRHYGRLSVVVGRRCRVSSLFDVPPQAFSPPPKVDSAVLSLRPLVNPRGVTVSDAAFERVVRVVFSQRRKTLRNVLRGEISAEALTKLGLDPGARPQQLSVEEFSDLAAALAARHEQESPA